MRLHKFDCGVRYAPSNAERNSNYILPRYESAGVHYLRWQGVWFRINAQPQGQETIWLGEDDLIKMGEDWQSGLTRALREPANIVNNEDWESLRAAIDAGEIREVNREEGAIAGVAECVNYVAEDGACLHTVQYAGERAQILPGHGSL